MDIYKGRDERSLLVITFSSVPLLFSTEISSYAIGGRLLGIARRNICRSSAVVRRSMQ